MTSMFEMVEEMIRFEHTRMPERLCHYLRWSIGDANKAYEGNIPVSEEEASRLTVNGRSVLCALNRIIGMADVSSVYFSDPGSSHDPRENPTSRLIKFRVPYAKDRRLQIGMYLGWHNTSGAEWKEDEFSFSDQQKGMLGIWKTQFEIRTTHTLDTVVTTDRPSLYDFRIRTSSGFGDYDFHLNPELKRYMLETT